MIDCARDICEVNFMPATHGQIFCSADCRQIVVNAKLVARYHEKKANRLGLARTCNKCSNKLSRYNDDNICGPCEMGNREDNMNSIKELFQ